MNLINNIFFIDKFFFKYLSFTSKSSILHNEILEKIFRFITKFGEGYFELLLIVILSLFILFNKTKFNNLKKYIVAILITLLFTQIFVNLFKLLFGRARPAITSNPEKFYGILTLVKNNLLFNADYASFPSGHTITIWGTIWILYFCMKNKFLKILLFVLGSLVGISRVYLAYHWTTDVIASIIISYFIAKFIYQKFMIKFI